MLHSMTAYASVSGAAEGYTWTWEVRGVNSKGLDLRIRVPDWIDGLEAQVRAAFTKKLGRGNVQISLRVHRDDDAADMFIDAVHVARLLDAISEIEATADNKGISLSTSTAADILAMRGVTDSGARQDVPDGLGKALVADLPFLTEAFVDMRAAEGAALQAVADKQVSGIEKLTKAAHDVLPARQVEQETAFRTAMARILEVTDALDEGRIAQELATLAIKGDIIEELDRLTAHIAAARELLSQTGPVGRKLDFLSQEFNREANTLCSKAAFPELTRIGLDLKVAIDQMREQIQNVE